MAESTYIASALVTGCLLLGVLLLASRLEDWREYDLALPETRSRTAELADSPAAWTAVFLLAALVAGGGAVLLVSDIPFMAALGGSWVPIVAVFGVLLGAYLLWGTYSSARFRGLHSAQAALLSAWLLGVLFVAAVAGKLITAT